MYGPVKATSRRLGVRQAPFRAGTAARSRPLVGSPLQTELRASSSVVSLARPVKAPQGKHLLATVQSHDGEAAQPGVVCRPLAGSTHSGTVGTDSPVWGTPTL